MLQRPIVNRDDLPGATDGCCPIQGGMSAEIEEKTF
jgi:hypothetical protein